MVGSWVGTEQQDLPTTLQIWHIGNCLPESALLGCQTPRSHGAATHPLPACPHDQVARHLCSRLWSCPGGAGCLRPGAVPWPMHHGRLSPGQVGIMRTRHRGLHTTVLQAATQLTLLPRRPGCRLRTAVLFPSLSLSHGAFLPVIIPQTVLRRCGVRQPHKWQD